MKKEKLTGIEVTREKIDGKEVWIVDYFIYHFSVDAEYFDTLVDAVGSILPYISRHKELEFGKEL